MYRIKERMFKSMRGFARHGLEVKEASLRQARRTAGRCRSITAWRRKVGTEERGATFFLSTGWRKAW